MGANGDAGTSTIGSRSTTFGAFAGDPVQSPRGDILVLVREYPSRIGILDSWVHPTRVDPALHARVNAEDLPTRTARNLTALGEPVQATHLFSAQATVSAATSILDYLKTCRPLVGR